MQLFTARYLGWLVAGVFLPISCLAQLALPQTNVQSPNVASLQANHSSSAAPYTGAPTVDIPLYTLSEGAINVPIALRYNSTGFRPDDHPGWVGLGWSLEAGGVVSRSVVDLPDELTMDTAPLTPLYADWAYKGQQHSPFYHAGLYWPHTYRPGTNGYSNQFVRFHDPLDLSTGVPFSSLANTIDTESDEYSFNFMGYSGKFYLNTNYNCTLHPLWKDACRWTVKSEGDIRVQLLFQPGPGGVSPDGMLDVPFDSHMYLLSTQTQERTSDPYYPKTFAGFVLTTPDGARYTFGGNTDAIEYGIGLMNAHQDYWVANAWHLVEVAYPNGQKLAFEYEPGIPARTSSGGTLKRIGSFTCQLFFSGQSNMALSSDSITCGGVPSIQPEPKNNLDGRLLRPVYLQRLYTVTADSLLRREIRFGRTASTEMPYPEAGLQLYEAIQRRICNAWGAAYPNCPEADFLRYVGSSDPVIGRHGWVGFAWPLLQRIEVRSGNHPLRAFKLRYTNSSTERLKLLEVRECDSTFKHCLPPYQFTYYQNQNGPEPAYHTGQIDHWGYYNGLQHPLDWSDDSAGAQHLLRDRRPANHHLPYQIGMLRTMITPLGEQTTFTYENHTYSRIYDRAHQGLTTVGTGALQQQPGYYHGSPIAGGVRLASLTRTARVPADTMVVRPQRHYFYYHTGGNSLLTPSSGILAGEISYNSTATCIALMNGNVIASYSLSTRTIQNGQSIAANGAGTHIGYSCITERLPDSSLIRREYSNFDRPALALGEPTISHPTDDPAAPVPFGIGSSSITQNGPFTSYEEERGKLLQEVYFDKTNRCVRRRSIYYGYQAAPPNQDSTIRRGIASLHYNTRTFKSQANNACIQADVNKLLLASSFVYARFCSALYIVADTTTTYEVPSGKLTTFTRSRYNHRRLLAWEKRTDSQGNLLQTSYAYPPSTYDSNYTLQLDPGLADTHRWNVPLETVTKKNGQVIGATAQDYSFSALGPYIIRQLAVSAPLTNFQHRERTTFDPHYRDQQQILYDGLGMPAQTARPLPQYRADDYAAFRWGYGGTYLIAKGQNTPQAHLCVGTFEEKPQGGGPLQELAGGWKWNGAVFYRQVRSHHTGHFALDPPDRPAFSPNNTRTMPTPPPTVPTPAPAQRPDSTAFDDCNPLVIPPPTNTCCDENGWSNAWQDPMLRSDNPFWCLRTELPADSTILRYRLSFWARRTNDAVAGAFVAWRLQSVCRLNGRFGSVGVADTTWRYYEVTLSFRPTDDTRTIQLGGHRVLIDDVCLAPVTAQVTTYTHDPLIGVTSITSPNQRTAFYHYDRFGRLKAVTDDDGNILKAHEYIYRP